MLQVAMGGEVISSSVVFEYKARDLPALPSSQHDWLSLDGESFCLCILTTERCRVTVLLSGVIYSIKSIKCKQREACAQLLHCMPGVLNVSITNTA